MLPLKQPLTFLFFSASTVTARVVALLLLPSCCGSFVVAVAVNNVAIAAVLRLFLM